MEGKDAEVSRGPGIIVNLLLLSSGVLRTSLMKQT
jgi:hypothetical protein